VTRQTRAPHPIRPAAKRPATRPAHGDGGSPARTGAPPALTAATLMAVALALLAGAGATPASAQAAVELEHVGTFAESFGYLRTVRPLDGGRVMVADPLGGVLAVLDLAAGTMEPVGREGGGPGEWRQPDAVYPLPDGRTLLVDLGNARLTVLGADGAAGETYPMALTTGDGPGGLEILVPGGTDAAGRVYFLSRARPGARPGEDSSRVKVWEPGSGATTALAALRPPAVTVTTSGGADDRRVSMRAVPLALADDWVVAPDGRVAVVRAEPYRVEWVSHDGAVTRGPGQEHDPIRIRDAEKERWLDGTSGTGLRVGVSVDNGVRTIQLGRGGPSRGEPSASDYEWPETLPPFREGGTVMDPDGRVWVARFERAGSPRTYDVFDGSGRLVRRVRLPDGQRVIGFDDHTVFAVRVDDLGLNWLELYRRPR
jgi:streptogramin lyase